MRAIIDATNITRLRSARQIDFADWPPEAGEIESGWFVVGESASWLLVKTADQSLMLFDENEARFYSQNFPGAGGDSATILDAYIDEPAEPDAPVMVAAVLTFGPAATWSPATRRSPTQTHGWCWKRSMPR